MRFALFVFLCFLASLSVAQHTTVLRGQITDNEDGMPLHGVLVRVAQHPLQTYSEEDGSFQITLIGRPDTVEVRFDLAGYEVFIIPQIPISPGEANFISLEMKRLYLDMSEVTIEAADSVWGSDVLHVADYAFLRGGLLLLTYEKEDRWKRQEEVDRTLYAGCRLILVDSLGVEDQRILVHEEAESFYLGYPGEIFLKCRNGMFHVRTDEENITLTPFPKTEFEELVKPVVDTIGNMTIFSTYNPDYPAFDYIAFNRTDSSYLSFRHLVDEKTMELFRSEFKYLDPRDKLTAFRYQLRTGIDKEVVAAYMSGFQHSNYYTPLNIPMIVSRDTLVIFDHHHDRVFRYSPAGEPLDSAEINYHKVPRPDRWSGRILADSETGKIYTCIRRNGTTYLEQIDPSNGTTNQVLKLYHEYVDRIEVRNGWVYYIYRPFESSLKRYLWRERL